MRLLPLVATLVLAVACGGDSPTAPSPSSQAPPPATTTPTLSGTVTSTASAGIIGARVTFLDGPNAGRSAITSTGGSYTFQSLTVGNGNLEATADGFISVRQGISLTGAQTLNFSLAAVPVPVGPRTTFGGGQYRVGTDIAPGRYYTDPTASCYWERQRGFGGTTGDIIANEFIGFDARQWIVDILPSDLGFETDADCRTWSPSPPHGPQPNIIPPGLWRVGDQIAAGTYTANVSSGCYWERVRNFEGTIGAVIANDFVSSGGQRIVTIASSDAGFHNDGDCGTWTRSQGLTINNLTRIQSGSDMSRNRALRRSKALRPLLR